MLCCLVQIQAIHGYRETERLKWGPACEAILNRVRAAAFLDSSPLLGPVHVLDLDKTGYIKPHIDSVKVGLWKDVSHPILLHCNVFTSCALICSLPVLWQHHRWRESFVRQHHAFGKGGCAP